MRHAVLTSTTAPAHNVITLSVRIMANILQAMLDSGATFNFIHEAVVEQLSLKPTPCAPIRVTLANGELLTHTRRLVVLQYSIAGVPHQDTFYVAPIGSHSLILGMPWLERHNPLVD